jgi:hypothetical protein
MGEIAMQKADKSNREEEDDQTMHLYRTRGR